MRLPARTPGEADQLAALSAELGGKGAGLAALAGLGLPVPPWVPVLASTCDRVLARARPELDAALAGLGEGPPDRAAFEAAAARIGRAIREAGFVPADAERLAADLERALPGDALLAVRSSAVGEDGEEDSFAGQLDTFLAVPRAEVPARALDALASAFGARALLYRRARGLPLEGIRAAVIVQRLVEARRAGVLFTANPASGDVSEAVVVAGLGLGEGVVSGRVAVDEWTCELATGVVRRSASARKRTRVVAARGGGTAEEAAPAADVERPALSDAEVARLVALGRTIAEAAGAPQDVEWALDPAGEPWVLQARPITALARGREHVFDNANIVEGYPGLTSPLTFTFVRAAYATTFREAARAFGVPEEVLAREARVFEHLVALVDGRVVYDLLSWYRMYRLVPGFEGLLAGFEAALGIPPRGEERGRPAGAAARAGKWRVRWRMLRLFSSHPRWAASFLERLAAERARHARLDLSALDGHALLEEVEGLAARLNAPYAITAVNDLFTFQLHALVERLLRRWGVDGAAALRDGLLSGIRGVESLEPVKELAAIAEAARTVPEVIEALESTLPPEEAWIAIRTRPATQRWRDALRAHLARHGERTLEELKLETPTLLERPDHAVALLRHALVPSALAHAERGGAAEAARARVAEALRGHPLRRRLLAFLVERCRGGLRRRESLRLARARMFAMARATYRALGDVLVRDGLLATRDDVFWLGADELSGLVRGHAIDPEPRRLVELRKATWAAHARREPAPRIVTHGTVLARPFPQAPRPPGGRADVLRGTGCCPGVARGPARVVRDATRAPPVRGHVLVAPSTDPGWIFLMVSAAALVSERGNPLSHTAIVGRELGIPTVVGVPGATSRFEDGEELEVDGGAGTVTRVG